MTFRRFFGSRCLYLIVPLIIFQINQSEAIEAQGFWTSDKFYNTSREEIVNFADYNKALNNGTVIGDGSLGAGDNAISFGAGSFWDKFNFESNNQQYYLESLSVVLNNNGANVGQYLIRGHYKIIEYDPETNTVYRQGYDIDRTMCWYDNPYHANTCTKEQRALAGKELTDEQQLELFNEYVGKHASISSSYNLKYTAIATRKLTNVSAGDITATSTDAVTGSQLYALQEKINNGNDYFSVNASDAEASTETSAKAQGAHSIAVGENAVADGTNSTVIGYNATAGAANSIALGSDSQTFTTDVLASDTNGIISVGSSAEDTGFTRRIVNVSDGVNDTDAATFGQLRNETRISESSDDNTYAYISVDKSAAENIVALDSQVKANTSSLDSKLDTGLSTLTAEGENKITSLAQNSTNVIGDGTNVAIGSATENGVKTYTISVADNGTISLDETKLVTGGTVASETRVSSDGNYVKADNTAGSNISLLDAQVASNAASISNNTSLIQQNTQALNSKLDIDLTALSDTGRTAISSLAQDAIEVNGSGNVSVSSQTTDGTKRFSISVADNGIVSSSETRLVTGQTVAAETRTSKDGSYVFAAKSAAENILALDTQIYKNTSQISENTNALSQKLNSNLDNLSADGKKSISSLVQVISADSEYLSVDSVTDTDGTQNITLKVNADGTISGKNDKGIVTGATVATALNDSVQNILSSISTSGSDFNAAIRNQAKGSINVKAEDGQNLITVTKNSAADDGIDTYSINLSLANSLAADQTGLITADVLRNEVRVASDGNYIQQSGSVSDNLTALDTGLNTISTAFTSLQNFEGLSATAIKNFNNYVADSFTIQTASNSPLSISNSADASGIRTWVINVNDSGKIEEGDTNLVTGDTVWSYVKDFTTGAGFAAIDASNINPSSWISKLGTPSGTAAISQGNTALISGAEVFSEVRVGDATDGTSYAYLSTDNTASQNLVALDLGIQKLMDLSNITDAGKSTIGNIAADALTINGNTHVSVAKDTSTRSWTISVDDSGKIAEGDTNLVTGDTVWSYVKDFTTGAGFAAIDASNINPSSWISKLGTPAGTSAISQGNTALISGAEVFSKVPTRLGVPQSR